MDNAIETENLTKEFDGLVAVDHINLNVKEGEIFGFLGPNGDGKTTTIKMLCTILNPTSGWAKVCGYMTLGNKKTRSENTSESCFKIRPLIDSSLGKRTWISMPECITWIGRQGRKGLQRYSIYWD